MQRGYALECNQDGDLLEVTEIIFEDLTIH
jgi:hypothetical protein